jgi:hypothetical protein
MTTIAKDSATVIAVVEVLDTGGEPWTGVEHNEAGLEIHYWKRGGSATELTLSAGNWTEVEAGSYEVTLPASLAEAVGIIEVRGLITDGVVIGDRLQVVGYNPSDAAWLRPTTAGRTLAVDEAGKVTVPDTQKVDAHTARGRAIGDVGEGNTFHGLQAADAGDSAVLRDDDPTLNKLDSMIEEKPE